MTDAQKEVLDRLTKPPAGKAVRPAEEVWWIMIYHHRKTMELLDNGGPLGTILASRHVELAALLGWALGGENEKLSRLSARMKEEVRNGLEQMIKEGLDPEVEGRKMWDEFERKNGCTHPEGGTASASGSARGAN